MKFFKKGCDYVRYHGFMSVFYLFKFVSFYLRRFSGRGSHVVKRINRRYNMYLDPRDRGISRALCMYGTRERDQVSIAQETLIEGMRVLDIGANVGYYALLEAQLVGRSGRVYAYEPHPGNFRMLRKNVELNNLLDRVELHQKGVSDRGGSLEFFLSPRSNLHTLNPKRFKDDTKIERFDDSIEIDVVDIAKVIEDKGDVDFIRMDIEGHEVEVLNGLFRGIEKGLDLLPSILLETHFPKYDEKNHNMKQAILNLLSRGYDIETIVSNNEFESPLRMLGYKPKKTIKTDQVYRGIYKGVDNMDAIYCACDIGGIRAMLLTPKEF
ncbi:MAG: FkbM family methyltransferase [Candidatus Omnitrophica bacterium]|nr:FkbM family methyltransferase [Candidatus Omnitrophota bacterium]